MGKKHFTTLLFIVGLGMAVVAGCRSTAGCPECGSAGYAPQSYPAANAAPSYNQNYQQPIQGSSGSGSRRAPIFQGSGTR